MVYLAGEDLDSSHAAGEVRKLGEALGKLAGDERSSVPRAGVPPPLAPSLIAAVEGG